MVIKSMSEKKQKNLSEQKLENMALCYLSRYESSTEKLRSVLENKIRREKIKGTNIPSNIEDIISDIVLKMQNLGYVDDSRYAENLIRKMKEKGKSRMQIEAKAKMVGIEINLDDYDDCEAAEIFALKHNMGIDAENYMKELLRMTRAGFSYRTACKALDKVKST